MAPNSDWYPTRELHLAAGEPTQAASMFRHAWGERPEFHTRSYEEALQQFKDSIECNDRIELLSESGGAVIVAEVDPHVGPCMSVQYAYIKPAARSPGNFRLILKYLTKYARERAIPVVAYTGREREGRFFVQYKRLRSKDGQSS